MPKRNDQPAVDESGAGLFENAVTLLRILQLIPQRRWTTVREIEAALAGEGIAMHRRTLQRYLKTIREHADVFPVTVDASARPYRVQWSTASKGLHLPALTPQETLLLRLAEEHLRFQLPAGILQSLKPLFRDAKQQVQLDEKAGSRSKACSWLRKVKVVSLGMPFMPPVIRQNVFENVTEALFLDRLLAVRYRSARGKITEARVMPLGLVQQDVRTYLVCRFEGFSDCRHLALHRIESARVTAFDFERPADFDLEDYTARAPFNYAQGRTVRLTLLTDDPALVQNLRETPFNSTQQIEPAALGSNGKPSRWTIAATLEDSLLLDGWLAMRRQSILKSEKAVVASAPANGAEAAASAAPEGAAEPRGSQDDHGGEAALPAQRFPWIPEDSIEIENRRVVCRPRGKKTP